MPKTVLDLYNLCKTKELYSFSADETNDKIAVTIPCNMTFSAVEDNGDHDTSEYETAGLFPVHLAFACNGINVNHVDIPKEALQESLSTLKHRPILGDIQQNEDGEYDFFEHSMIKSSDGDIEYIERPVGVLTNTDNASLIYDAEKDKYFAHCDGYIYEDYGNKAMEIIERKIENEEPVRVSAELIVLQFHFDLRRKVVVFDRFYVNGVTILGTNPITGKIVNEAMKGSHLEIADFSEKKNSQYANFDANSISELSEKLDKLLAIFNKNPEKGENEPKMNEKLKELLEKYGKTEADINFEFADMSDEELEAKFAAEFTKATEDNADVADDAEPTTVDEPTTSEEEAPVSETTETIASNNSEDENAEAAVSKTETATEPETEATTEPHTFSIVEGNQTFAVRLDDIDWAVHKAVNDAYGNDEDWYSTEVFADGQVIMHCNGKHYKQNWTYATDTQTASLDGERVEVLADYLTPEEKGALEIMRASFSELEKYKSDNEAKKLEDAQNEVIAQFSEMLGEDEAFTKLVSEKASFSVEELTLRCKALIGEKQIATFAEKSTKKTIGVPVVTKPVKKPYGTLFDED